MLTDKRHSFTEDKLEMHMINHFNNKYNFKNKLSSENSLNFFLLSINVINYYKLNYKF
jgi:hypothetical protein